MREAAPIQTQCFICLDYLDGPSGYSCPKLECQERLQEWKSADQARYDGDGPRKRVRAQQGRPFRRDPVTGLKLRVEV